ncbi:phosphoinositide phosphatase SAC8 isoform X2 [Amborella trichopoda]|uniref:phosphoinositide phosphatase SAC8 isoform X2 n=1 Tax=Amborella trichopoda TaxID=13333 RepID=UPI0005D37B40|nr:phosphoinositide phosphatase SAC8 isoform X2 [Amborella trichopoda]|eukprot:XP_020522342.1 phosphoinositide phosphatase SAC8 isoform X2 [Amborella trichopoda]
MENGDSVEGHKLCTQMQLQEFADKYVIKPIDPGPFRPLSISRFDGVIQEISEPVDETPSKVSIIYGVVGTIKLLAGMYLLVITSRKQVGTHSGFPIFQIVSMKFLSCNEALKQSSYQEKRDEAYFMSLLKTVESTTGLYFSYEADLTLNLQRTYKLPQKRTVQPLWKQVDPRFLWNRNLLEELIESKFDEYIIPLVQGSFQTVQITVKGSPAQITLISRRCTRRLGTRMWRRGANLAGDTANFIETEQLLNFEGFQSSYLQIRGSIPVLWEQIVDLSYKPRPRIINHEETPNVVARHFHDLTQRYGQVLVLDLTDQHGDEGQLSAAFAKEMHKLSHIRYLSYDFHSLCGKGNFENLDNLFAQIFEDFEKHRFFLMKSDGEILLEQTGIGRANCIDCLDRTNVTQSFLAWKSLNIQLERMGLDSPADSMPQHSDVYDKFRTLWVDHGDEISLQYSGTHALKGDLVRYGRQTLAGLVKDGMSAVSRYYLNNFHDGVRQDAMDLISGHYTVSRSCPSPFPLNGFESFSYLPVASAILVGGLTLTTVSLNQAGRGAQHFLSSVLWAGMTAGLMAVVKANGRQFCSRPHLCDLL